MENFRQDAREVAGAARYGIWLGFTRVVIPVLLLIGITSVAVWAISHPFQVADKVTDPDRMIYTYERFHDLHERIKATEAKIAIKELQIRAFMADLPENWRDNTGLSREHNMLQVELAGLRENRLNQVAEYNALAAKATRGFLRDGGLPERMD